MLEMSTVTEEGVSEVRNEACDRLLAHRLEIKLQGKKVEGILNRLHVAVPTPRDSKERPPFIPEAALQKKMDADGAKRKLERHIEAELGDDYILDLKKNYDLPEEEKYDVIPEIWEGKNIADYIDPEILEKLKQLEAEEELRDQAGFYDFPESEDDEEMKEIRSLARQIRKKKAILSINAKIDNTTKPKVSRPIMKRRERSVSRLRSEMSDLGVELDNGKTHFKRAASEVRTPRPLKRKREDSEGRVRSSSKTPRDESGVRDAKMRRKVKTLGKRAQRAMNRQARKGEADRTIPSLRPKHLLAGRRGVGKADRR